MASEFDFHAFRRRLEEPPRYPEGHAPLSSFDAIRNTCRWAARPGDFDSTIYCFGRKPKDTHGLLDLFVNQPHIRQLEDVPSGLIRQAFCKLHAHVAISAQTDGSSDPEGSQESTEGDLEDVQPQSGKRKLPYLKFLGGRAEMRCVFENVKPEFRNLQPDWDEDKKFVKLLEDPEPSDYLHTTAAVDVEAQRDEKQVSASETEDDESAEDDGDDPADEDYCPPELSEDEDDNDEEISDIESDEVEGLVNGQIADDAATKDFEKKSLSQTRDPIYDQPVTDNESDIVEAIRETLKVNHPKPGFVYAVLDTQLGLIKIGSTAQSFSKRIGAIYNQCNPGKELEIIAGDQQQPMLAYKRLERLIHLDLRPHRWHFYCVCGKNKNTKHREWFRIEPNVARRTVQVWRDFLVQDPYGELMPTKFKEPRLYPLMPHWSSIIYYRALPDTDEQHEFHNTRIRRWRNLFQGKHEDTPQRPKDELLKSTPTTKIKTEPSENESLTPSHHPSKRTERASASRLSPVLGKGKNLTKSKSHSDLRTHIKDAEVKQERTEAPSASPPQMPTRPKSFKSANRGNDKSLTPPLEQPRKFTLTDPSHDTKSTTWAQVAAESRSGSMQIPSSAQQYQNQTKIPSSRLFRTTKPTSVSEVAAQILEALRRLRLVMIELLPQYVLSDLIQFGRPLACAVILALCSSFLPAGLSFVFWLTFLPFFVAELRGWNIM